MNLKKSILVVEDEKNMQLLVKHLLVTAGYVVSFADNGLTAQTMISQQHYDLIITDVMMSGIDGLELCAWLKRQESRKMIPIIILSSKAQLSDLEKGKLAGADYYMTKPFDIDELLTLTKQILPTS